MKKQPEVTDMTKSSFVEAFCDYYRTQSIDKISIKELAAKAGYSRATFYNYFTDVYDLLEYIEDELVSDLMKRVEAQMKEDHSLEGFIDSFVESVTEKETYISVFMNESNSSSFISKMKQKMIPLLLDVFAVPDTDLQARYALEFYLSGLIPVLGVWFREGRRMPVDELAALIQGILKDGILDQIRR